MVCFTSIPSPYLAVLIVLPVSVVINRSQFVTPMPMNCDDHDLLHREDTILTTSSFVRVVAREALLIPEVLDGLGSLHSRLPITQIYEHVLRSDQEMRNLVRQMPAFLIRDTERRGPYDSSVWLPVARRTLAISAADKIIMIHRPVLLYSFQNEYFSHTRTTCVAAATAILREHEQATLEQTLSIWTQTAFCVTAAMVLGLQLLHHSSHVDEQASQYRTMLIKAAQRLRGRRGDVLAARGARLIDAFLSAEEDLVVRVMRRHGGSMDEKEREVVNQIIQNQELLARFLNLGTNNSLMAVVHAPPEAEPSQLQAFDVPILDMSQFEGIDDFDVWFNEIFAPAYSDPVSI